MEFMGSLRRNAGDSGNNMSRKFILILPPLDLPTHPYPAVPQLVSWLRERGHGVDGVDLNIRFFRWALTKEKIQKGRVILDRLRNADKALSRPEAYHLKFLEKVVLVVNGRQVVCDERLKSD